MYLGNQPLSGSVSTLVSSCIEIEVYSTQVLVPCVSGAKEGKTSGICTHRNQQHLSAWQGGGGEGGPPWVLRNGPELWVWNLVDSILSTLSSIKLILSSLVLKSLVCVSWWDGDLSHPRTGVVAL